ncbi:hypothetical protein CONCODRAFT_18327 [Conidiobolus coronatus NRRL 28638]|uniref:Uncharacterized protein n=1 Tax=Conidiobolus coronatus (strain ATCC 28846 / CBS 209.66 / NRRL 28638) TaxID=796925 RepID=A0A137P3C6_CONC2|nr:hypothetical protein CONCODRAFT_18327 [Conidiobolus coronatus NRRL 28638]|eukprot:KXN69421.1 hypothetical protein CONCODRAFT_18327 [Conidiobolus coronatus NRRL 28638]
MSTKEEPKWKAVHDEKVKNGELHYEDPDTGYFVFTELSHKKRGYCCGSQCRHCPFDFENVGKPDKIKEDKKQAKLNKLKF